MAEIILASASPRRRELLALAGVDFTVKVADVEEIIPENASPDEVVKSLALQKAQAVAQMNPDSIVIGSDTVVALGNTILGKPQDEENAVEISGKLTYDDGDVPKIILSSVSPLLSNTAYSERSKAISQSTQPAKSGTRVFIRLAKFDNEKLNPIYRIATLHSGKCEVVIFDQSTNKYVSMKNVKISDEESVIERLRSLFGAENVVLK